MSEASAPAFSIGAAPSSRMDMPLEDIIKQKQKNQKKDRASLKNATTANKVPSAAAKAQSVKKAANKVAKAVRRGLPSVTQGDAKTAQKQLKNALVNVQVKKAQDRLNNQVQGGQQQQGQQQQLKAGKPKQLKKVKSGAGLKAGGQPQQQQQPRQQQQQQQQQQPRPIASNPQAVQNQVINALRAAGVSLPQGASIQIQVPEAAFKIGAAPKQPQQQQQQRTGDKVKNRLSLKDQTTSSNSPRPASAGKKAKNPLQKAGSQTSVASAAGSSASSKQRKRERAKEHAARRDAQGGAASVNP